MGEQFNMSMKWWRGPLCNRPTRLAGFV